MTVLTVSCNFKEYQNCILGSKVLGILLKGWFLLTIKCLSRQNTIPNYICGVATTCFNLLLDRKRRNIFCLVFIYNSVSFLERKKSRYLVKENGNTLLSGDLVYK